MYREELPKEGEGWLRQFVDLTGGLGKEQWEYFLRGDVDTLIHTMKLAVILPVILIYWCQCLCC